MSQKPSLDELWNFAPDAVPPSEAVFNLTLIENLPEPARRYLTHAIAPGTPLALAVRLQMHGKFRLKGWRSFTAEQVIRRDGEMLWCADMSLYGLPMRGFDALLKGQGKMQWKLLNLFPLVTAEGTEVTRSAIGRVAGETVWLPSLLCAKDVKWTSPDASHAHAEFSLFEEKTELMLTIGEAGQPEQIRYKRWGNPEGGEFRYTDFGGIVEEEQTFNGYTIPTRMRAGWHFGTERFETEGEFFRVTLDKAIFR
ncbi:MAG: hypothetical protein H7308_01960 [Chthonomonadaceae bacterium]|nr:hypothetical protein [Chthonomonadaceae bacterium]